MQCLEEKMPIIKDFEKRKRVQFEKYFSTAPDWIIASCSPLYLEKGEIFVKENTVADTIYFVGKGAIKAMDYRISGIAYEFMRFDDVYALGGVEVLTREKLYKATLQTNSNCAIVKLSRKKFEQWLDIDPHVLRIEAEHVSNYLLEQARRSRACIFLQGADRIAYILLDIFEKQRKDGVLNVKITQSEFAELTGVSTKTVYRSLKMFENKNWIIRSKKWLTMNEDHYHNCKNYIDNLIFR